MSEELHKSAGAGATSACGPADRSATAAAYALAALVHLGTAVLTTAGLLLVVVGWYTVVQPLIGLVMLAVATQVRPHLSPPGSARVRGRDLPAVTREQGPVLYELLDRIADAAGAPRHIGLVRLDADFAVGVTSVGARGTRTLVIGLPLWVALPPQQRVAALAQALALEAQPPVEHRLFVCTALNSLSRTSRLAAQDPDSSAMADRVVTAPVLSRRADEMVIGARQFALHTRAIDLALWLPGLLARVTARVLRRLTLPSARHAEHRADDIAARIASTEAAVSALECHRLAHAAALECHRLAVAARSLGTGARKRSGMKELEEEFWARLAAHTRMLPRPGLPSPDGDQDPRTARLRQAPEQPATIVLTAATAAAVDDEMCEAARTLARLVLKDMLQ